MTNLSRQVVVFLSTLSHLGPYSGALILSSSTSYYSPDVGFNSATIINLYEYVEGSGALQGVAGHALAHGRDQDATHKRHIL